jgi:phage tail sheath gpL-like
MPIAFSGIPAGWKIPLYWAELDSSMAGLSRPNLPALMVGTMLPTGDATPDVVVPIGTQSQADARFGIGSEVSRMFKAFFANGFANEVRGLGVVEPAAGTKATGALTIATVPTDAGTIHLYIGAEHVPINVAASDTEEEIANAIAEAVNEREWLPITASGPSSLPFGPPVNDGAAPVASAAAPEVGVEVNVSDGGWSGNPAPDFTYAWSRDTAGDGAFLPIAGEAANTYTLADDDVDNMIRATVTATNTEAPAGVAANTAPYGPITVPAPPLSAPVNDGAAPAITETFSLRASRRGNGTARMAPADVTFTCKWAGVNGNDIRISLNYFGDVGGEIMPPGLTIHPPATGFLTGGVGVPDFTNAISNLGESIYEFVAMPYTDATPLRAWGVEYGFSDAGRWGWMRQLYGHIFSAKRGTYAALITFGENGNNSAATSVMGFEVASPSPAYEWAAAYCSKAQRALVNDPARPLQTLQLEGILLAPPSDRFILSEINTLASYGIATQMASADNVQPMISRESTSYRLNVYGFEDDAYELVTTLSTLAALLRGQRFVITTKYARCKLANDGTRFGPGQRVATPGIIKAELVSNYRVDMFNGLVENIRAFKDALIVERDPNNPNRLNVLYPPDLINQLRIFAVLAQFRLQYDRNLDTAIAA